MTPPASPTWRSWPTSEARTSVGFLERAVAFYAAHGIAIERVMTDNGSGYVSIVHAIACRAMGIRHIRTRPYRPRTNGKAERFIQTMLRRLGLRGDLPRLNPATRPALGLARPL